jgi:hypothetical protein
MQHNYLICLLYCTDCYIGKNMFYLFFCYFSFHLIYDSFLSPDDSHMCHCCFFVYV